ncbi:replication protein A 70 kDa DNA-binding subunit A-like isoform X1 [Papaver somniferum]|uniref:replication protein A 70 kDa DNA-binding subunit A-like isoform X1 n=2 Tax=Papaver somniferum TaxID=3469 RepID=UPI000E701A55|nr:replication protein A 70 kDa DNA-binding subunit A-like isoform X1 [Papaver somniferum]
MKMVVLKYDGFPTSINKDSTTNGIPHSCNNGTTVNSGLTLPIQTNCLPSSTGEPKMEQPATNNDSLESNDDNYMFVNDPISEAKENILTTGAISKIAKGQKERNLIVQVVHSFQSIEENQFMFISDGLHMQIAILAQSLNHLILSGKLKTGSVVQLVEYICPTAHNGMQMIVVSMEVKIFENEFIGEPKLYVEPAPNLDDGKKEHLTEDKDTSFFMHQSHLLGNHQDLYLANKNNTAIRGDIVPLAQPSI